MIAERGTEELSVEEKEGYGSWRLSLAMVSLSRPDGGAWQGRIALSANVGEMPVAAHLIEGAP